MIGNTEPTRRSPKPPPRIDEIMLDFGRPVVSFVPQPRLEQFAAAPSITNGRIVEVSLSYSLLRHPHRRDHPENLLPLSAEQDRAIRRAEEGDLPEWMIDQIRRMRYPVLWEAVRTAVTIPTERARPLEARLGAHMKDALRLMPGANSRSRKTVQLREEELTRGAPIGVDGETVRGIRVDGDPDVVALGFRLDERQVTVVIERALAPLVRQEFVRYVP